MLSTFASKLLLQPNTFNPVLDIRESVWLGRSLIACEYHPPVAYNAVGTWRAQIASYKNDGLSVPRATLYCCVLL